MRIGIDLDGVCYPFIDEFREYCEVELNRELEVPLTWNFFSEQWGLGLDEFQELMARGVSESSLWWAGRPHSGCREALQALHDAGHEVVILTDRSPSGAEMEARWATMFWLATERIPHDDIQITKAKHEHDIDILLDDAPHHIEKAHAAGIKVYVRDRPWNRHIDIGTRVGSWSEFVGQVGTA